jgi:hypothetical protein
MARTVNAVAARIPDKKARKQWAEDCLKSAVGHEAYLGRKDKISVDATAAALAKLAGTKLPAEDVLQQPVLTAVSIAFGKHLDSPRDAKEAGKYAARLTAVAAQIKDPARRTAWLESLAAAIKGRETFPAGKKTLRDPSADAIGKLLAAQAAS